MSDAADKSTAVSLNRILEKVYRNGGYNFRDYKSGTMIRRLERRLQTTGIKDYPGYVEFLNSHPEEYEFLAQYLTIAVSGFFRNKYAFEQISRLVLPELISRQTASRNYSLRFWSTACARG